MSDERSLGERQRACVLCPHEDDNDDAMGYCAKHGTEMRDQADVAEETLRAVCESNQNNFERAETTEARLAATTGEVARLRAALGKWKCHICRDWAFTAEQRAANPYGTHCVTCNDTGLDPLASAALAPPAVVPTTLPFEQWKKCTCLRAPADPHEAGCPVVPPPQPMKEPR